MKKIYSASIFCVVFQRASGVQRVADFRSCLHNFCYVNSYVYLPIIRNFAISLNDLCKVVYFRRRSSITCSYKTL